jgi:MFS family permease
MNGMNTLIHSERRQKKILMIFGRFYGRRGAIFVAALFCLFSVVAAAFVTDKYAFLGCRILLGIGMGQKASVGEFVVGLCVAIETNVGSSSDLCW